MRFRPLGARVLVRRIGEESVTSGGIIIPELAREKPQEGEVTAVGPEVRDLKVSDRVLFGKWSGTEVRAGGHDLLIMAEGDIMGVIEA
jgi:chaperonin GroES